MKPLSVIPFVTFAALVVPNTVSAKCYKILAAKESIIYECKSSPNSFPGVIRDTLQFQFQGATVVSTEDEKCSAKVPACEDEKASEAVAGLHRAGIKKHGGNAADSQNACNDKLNSPSVCGRATARPPIPTEPSLPRKQKQKDRLDVAVTMAGMVGLLKPVSP